MLHTYTADAPRISSSTKGSGRGLGTYSIRLLTESYLGGRAWFDSAAGQGTTFLTDFAI